MSDEFKLESLAAKGKRIENDPTFNDQGALQAFVDMTSQTFGGQPEPAMEPYKDLPLKSRAIIAAAFTFAKAEFSQYGTGKQARELVADAAVGVKGFEDVQYQGEFTAREGMTPALQSRFQADILERHQNMDFDELRYMAGAAMIIHHQHQLHQSYARQTQHKLENAYDHRGAIIDELNGPLARASEEATADWQRHEQGAHKHINDTPTSRRALTKHVQGMAKAAEGSSAATLAGHSAGLAAFIEGYPDPEAAKAARPGILDKINKGDTLKSEDWRLLTASLERTPVQTMAENNEPLGAILKAAHDQDTAPKGLKDMAGLYIKAIDKKETTQNLSKSDILTRLSKNKDGLTPKDQVRLIAWNKAGADSVAGKDLAVMSVRVIESLRGRPDKRKTYGLAAAALSSQKHALQEQGAKTQTQTKTHQDER
jgi:hypothetical protein